jgi:hypothetical protein
MIPSKEYSPIVQWRLNSKLEGSYYVKYGTADIDWKKIDESSARALVSVGGIMLPPMLAGPDYTGKLVQVQVYV